MPTYFIDFDSWRLNAKNSNEAWHKALALVKQGKVPNISGVDECDEHPDEMYDYINLKEI